jgi:hypothetical protein
MWNIYINLIKKIRLGLNCYILLTRDKNMNIIYNLIYYIMSKIQKKIYPCLAPKYKGIQKMK